MFQNFRMIFARSSGMVANFREIVTHIVTQMTFSRVRLKERLLIDCFAFYNVTVVVMTKPRSDHVPKSLIRKPVSTN